MDDKSYVSAQIKALVEPKIKDRQWAIIKHLLTSYRDKTLNHNELMGAVGGIYELDGLLTALTHDIKETEELSDG